MAYNASRKIHRLSSQLEKKALIQIEGSTCSGKTSFVLGLCKELTGNGIKVMHIEEAATKVFKASKNILEQLQSDPESNQWSKAKLELQQRVISEQLASLKSFAENNEYVIAIMDRGGASTAYHTIPLLSNEEKESIKNLCRDIGKMATLTIMLSPLGFLKQDSYRYQKTINEIEEEAIGIKNYLDSWEIRYLEILPDTRAVRLTVGLNYILDELNVKTTKKSCVCYAKR